MSILKFDNHICPFVCPTVHPFVGLSVFTNFFVAPMMRPMMLLRPMLLLFLITWRLLLPFPLLTAPRELKRRLASLLSLCSCITTRSYIIKQILLGFLCFCARKKMSPQTMPMNKCREGCTIPGMLTMYDEPESFVITPSCPLLCLSAFLRRNKLLNLKKNEISLSETDYGVKTVNSLF